MSQVVATHIELRANRSGKERAYIDGTRVRVQDIAAMADVRGLTADQIVQALPHLTLSQVHAALSYYFDHREAIAQELRDDEQYAREFRAATGPGPLESRLNNSGAAGDAVSS